MMIFLKKIYHDLEEGPPSVQDFRDEIAQTWPKEIDDSVARRDWGWKANFRLNETLNENFK